MQMQLVTIRSAKEPYVSDVKFKQQCMQASFVCGRQQDIVHLAGEAEFELMFIRNLSLPVHAFQTATCPVCQEV